MEGENLRSDAQKRADKKYAATHYGVVVGKTKLQDIEYYKTYATKYSVSMSKLITSCINYCINNNIDITGGIKLNQQALPDIPGESQDNNDDI